MNDTGFLRRTNYIVPPMYLQNLLYPGMVLSPEGVFQVTSCSTCKTQSFETPLGSFSYRHVKPALFFGYQLVEWNKHHFVIAGPEITVIDYLYLGKTLKSEIL
jgi:hypothetical protein